MIAGVIGVEPITDEIWPLLTGRERKTAKLRPMGAVVGRFDGGPPVVLAMGPNPSQLAGTAGQMALTYGVACADATWFTKPSWPKGGRP